MLKIRQQQKSICKTFKKNYICKLLHGIFILNNNWVKKMITSFWKFIYLYTKKILNIGFFCEFNYMLVMKMKIINFLLHLLLYL